MSSDFEKISASLKSALQTLQDREGISAKISTDKEAGVIRVYGEQSDILKRASSALSEILELAYTTAEHHPYWGVIYHATEISKIILEEWNSELTQDQISELSWRADEIKNALERLGR